MTRGGSGARLAAWAVAFGCYSEPPTYSPQTLLPPHILFPQVEPPVGEVYEGSVPFELVVPFYSEDVGSPLEARVFLNLHLEPSAAAASPWLIEPEIPAGHDEEGVRTVTFAWDQSLPGCNSLTFVLSYASSFPSGVGLPDDDTRAAYLVWWLNTEDGEDQTLVDSCTNGLANQAVQDTRDAELLPSPP